MFCYRCGEKITKNRYYCPNCNSYLFNDKFKGLNYLFLCHRLPERSFFFRGHQFPICARCTGIFVGCFLGILSLLFFKNENIFLAMLLLLPTSIDGLGQYLGKWQSNNIRRFFTGVIAGLGLIFLFSAFEALAYNSGKNLGLKLRTKP